MPYALNPVRLSSAWSGGAGLARPRSAVFSGNLKYGVLSVWLQDALAPFGGTTHAHAFNIQFDEISLDPAPYWEIGVGVDYFNSVTVTVVHQNSPGTVTAFAWATNQTDWLHCQGHLLVSFDLIAGTAQAYINDVASTVSGVSPPIPALSGGIPFGSQVAISDNMPGGGGHISDLWFSQTPSFVDLSVVANRRRFIDASGLPVDLGTAGTAPFGTAPTLWQTIRAGGVAADFLTNRGGIGGTFASGTPSGTPTTVGPVEDPCVYAPPTELKLSIDNVVVEGAAAVVAALPCLISLEWSDDRGHHFGNPVSQPMGGTGEYDKTLTWQRLGMTRDRVFRVSWSCPSATALQGAWVEVTPEGKPR